MITRRRFIQHASLASLTPGLKRIPRWLITENEDDFTYQSAYLKLSLSRKKPQFSFFSTDSLGGGRFKANPLLEQKKDNPVSYFSYVSGNDIAYYVNKADKQTAAWQFKCQPDKITISTEWSPAQEQIMPLEINFSQVVNHCTALGKMDELNRMAFPCLLHFPGMGSFRLYCSDPAVKLFYDADRDVKAPFVSIALQEAGADHPRITYQLESVAIYPGTDKIKMDPRFDGFRRNFINIFQVNPRIMALANNSASDACAFTLFLYAEMAIYTPELVGALTAMDLLRNSLDRYLEGMKAYGQVGYKNGAAWHSEFDSSDSAASLIISACNYILHTKDMRWASKNYSGIKDWAMKMRATDHNQDGIIEYGYSGNSGSWDGVKRPANWWDTIGFGHDDAYSNALAYHSCRLISRVAVLLGKPEDAEDFTSFADKLKAIYYPHFYNKQTGLLAGWRSADGQLHDYYFTFVNSLAVYYGLVEGQQADLIMENLLNKMKDVGYTDFSLGLPGNLIPVAKEDYTDFNKRFGYDSFQVYENGGATACYAYFTLKALFKLNRRKEAEMILLPMLESFKNGGFEGNCPGSEMTKDWKTWTGECWGYEGFLVDNYLALLAGLDYFQKTD